MQVKEERKKEKGALLKKIRFRRQQIAPSKGKLRERASWWGRRCCEEGKRPSPHPGGEKIRSPRKRKRSESPRKKRGKTTKREVLACHGRRGEKKSRLAQGLGGKFEKKGVSRGQQKGKNVGGAG